MVCMVEFPEFALNIFLCKIVWPSAKLTYVVNGNFIFFIAIYVFIYYMEEIVFIFYLHEVV